MAKKYLSDEQIRHVYDAAVRAGLSPSRGALLAGIDPRFVLSLPTAPSPSAQLLNDLMEMNQVTALTDGTTPLFDWLSSAMLLAGPRHEADVFRDALASVKSALGVSPERSTEQPLGPGAQGSPARPCSGGPVRSVLWSAPDRARCFVAYAPQDERFACDLLKHLSSLERSGVLAISHPGKAIAGDLLDDVTRTLVLEADVILFMTSADLFDDPAAQAWIELALQRAGGGVSILPVLTRPVDLASTPLGAYPPLPGTGEPIAAFKMLDDAYADIARSVRALVADRAPARPPRRSLLDLDVDEFWVRPEASELLAVLCVSYDTFARVKGIASLAGVTMDDVTQSGGIRAVWGDLLRAAILADKLRTLLVTIQRDETVARYHPRIRGLIS